MSARVGLSPSPSLRSAGEIGSSIFDRVAPPARDASRVSSIADQALHQQPNDLPIAELPARYAFPLGLSRRIHRRSGSLLNNLSVQQSNLGRRQAALASAQEALDIRRKFAQARSEAFALDLATSLTNLGRAQSELGQREPALASFQAALDAIWPLYLR